ncbi:MAG: SDR family oxidoreductase [Flavobacteriales bacterium]|nr:SDR family oxidoreductase [Flavobacteriales bacterium]
MNRLKDKVVIVTGGSGLLGREFLKSINQEGGIAINADVNVEDDIENNQIQIDVTSEDSIREKIAMVHKHFGKIDGLVNNAYPRTKDWGAKFEDISFNSWEKNVSWQLNSYFSCIQHVAKFMRNQKHGSIVNISSIYGVIGPDFGVYKGTEMTMPAAYSAIKGGVNSLTRYLASYFGKDNVRVNCVSPGGIFDNQPKSFTDYYENKVPLNRMGNPDDIAPSVVFLLSEDAKYITGQNLIIDGGWTSI